MKRILLTGLLLSLLPLQAGAKPLSFFADWLLWQASEEATSFWANGSSLFSNPAVLNPPNLNFGYSQGLRGGLAYEPNQLWNVKLYWTYLPANQTLSINTADQVLIPEFFSGFLSQNFFFGSELNWTLYLNTLDLEASHEFRVTPAFTLSPLIGLKGARINQTVTSAWNALVYVAHENVLHQYYGLGPNLGVKGRWELGKNFSLIGNFSLAFMWGTWNIEDVYTRPSALGGLVQPLTITTYQNHTSLDTLAFDYFLGVEWTHTGKVTVSAKLGYEMQYWTNQLRIPTFQLLPVRGDLTLQGGTCGIYFGL